MPTIQEYIATHLRQRLDDFRSLVVYDQEERYREIVTALAGEDCVVIDGSQSTILGREQAMDTWRDMAAGSDVQHLLVYLPIKSPVHDEEKQQNPYQIFEIGGGRFPDGDGESYPALCRKAAPEQVNQIDQLFAAGIPDFATINNLMQGGGSWPKLRTLLKAESATEIVVALLSPADELKAALNQDDTWVPEVKEFLHSTLQLQLKTKGKKWQSISDEIWRYVLYSEFVFDLPVDLPEELKNVPRAPDTCRDIVYTICDTLRGTDKHQESYMEAARRTAEELHLRERVQAIDDFGQRDTFAFEERTFVKRFSEAILAWKYGEASEILKSRKHSIWVRQTTERQAIWTVADWASQLIIQTGDIRDDVNKVGNNLTGIFHFYTDQFRQIDLLHRNMERAISDTLGEMENLEQLIDTARAQYLEVAEALQAKFIDGVTEEGWPLSGPLRNNDIFDKFVAPWLKDRKKTALFMVDALRYELAVELEADISGKYKTEFHAVCAQLPTVTSVGMAALLPEVNGHLELQCDQGKIIPRIKEAKVVTPKDRLAYVQSIYGDLCAMIDLDKLVKQKTIKLSPQTNLLLVKTTDIDAFGETNPYDALMLLPRIISKIIAGISKLEKLGFERVVIGTDHGFILIHDQQAGDQVPKPPGDWQINKERCLLGRGSSSPGIAVFETEYVSISGDCTHYAVPKTFGTFSKTKPYFHQGLSLQECVLPVICVELSSARKTSAVAKVKLSYKGGSTPKITTRRPMIEISAFAQGNLFGGSTEIEFQLEAYSKKEVVGEAASCGHVNPANNLVRINPGQAIKVPLKMMEDFRGIFEVRAINPETMVNYSTVKLKTDYLE
ncbi:MAG: PglZ domain-containing protein [Thermodesulfobacteriota bacterium]|nr:PglZ domain-containing protein [Thermodesulfobacteriota bacterium]